MCSPLLVATGCTISLQRIIFIAMPQDATDYFQQLSGKLQQLSRMQEQLLKDNEKLRQEAAALREAAKASQEEITGLKEQVAALQTATGHVDEASRKDFEKRINQYLRDIDKVIAHLNTA